jgi:hypothetical protein
MAAPGGFIENSREAEARPKLTRAQIEEFLPNKGKFTFPAPYNTEAFRLTNSSDCGGGDCVFDVGYSYWPKINYHEGQDEMLIFVGMNRQSGGGGPSIIRFNKVTEEFSNPEPIFELNEAGSWQSGQQWYWSLNDPHTMYYPYEENFYKVNVLTGEQTVVYSPGNGDKVWQAHSSADGKVHSMEYRTSNYSTLGSLVYFEETGEVRKFPKTGSMDECQIDKSGRYLIIKEQVDGAQGEDNRIIDLETGTERLVTDPEGAGGHSDSGFGYQVNHHNYDNDPNTILLMEFDENPIRKTTVYDGTDWYSAKLNHISHCNSDASLPPSSQVAFASTAENRLSAHNNEIVAFKLDGSRDTLVIAPVMTDTANGYKDYYTVLPKGCCDYTGEYFLWTSNMAENRLDLFMVKVPLHLIKDDVPSPTPTVTATPIASAEPTPEPTPTPSSSASVEPIELSIANVETGDLTVIDDGDVITIDDNWSIVATKVPLATESVRFILTGARARTQVENVIPYCLFGDNGGTYYAPVSVPGNYTLEVSTFGARNARGDFIDSKTIEFTIESSAVEPTPTPTVSLSGTPEPTPTPTVSLSGTPEPTPTPTVSESGTPQPTPTPTVSESGTPQPTPTPTVSLSGTPEPTPTPTPVNTILELTAEEASVLSSLLEFITDNETVLASIKDKLK